MARQCIKPKRPRNSAWFKEKMLLAEALESGVVLDPKQMAFLADNRDTLNVMRFSKPNSNVKLKLFATVEIHKTLSTTVDVLKKESKAKEDKYIKEIIDLEKKKKALNNVVYKIVPALYCGHAIVKKHDALSIMDTEETLLLAKEKQAFWLPISESPPVQSEPVLKEISHKLPTISLVKDSFNNMRSHVDNFDKSIFHMFDQGLAKAITDMKVVFNQMDSDEQYLVHPAVNSLATIIDYQSMEKSYLDNIMNDTSSTNEAVNTTHDVPDVRSKGQASSSTYADDVMFSFFVNQYNSP
ncbi:hypothetical protein Tco_0561928 [Tanacetum coccineum]